MSNKTHQAQSLSETRPIVLSHNEITGIDLGGYRETPFFSTVDGQLCQWIEIDLACTEGWRRLVTLEFRSGERSAQRTFAVRQGEFSLRCYAPAIWPSPPDSHAQLVVRCEAKTAVGTATVGSHRPWTLYLLSDCCADDSWAYADLDQHDRDDYRSTLSELATSADNCYNYPSVYQIARFFRYATSEEQAALRHAFQQSRFYLSPVPNQLLCGAFTLSAYPLILEPYRHWCKQIALTPPADAAYHMEAPTWTNGLVNLLSCAGFRLFGKSLLRFLAPWIDALETLPVLTRLQVAPGRYVYLALRCNTYDEGHPLLAGQPQVNKTVHQQLIPRYERTGGEHPVSAIPIVGLYSDLHPELPDYAPVKVAAVSDYGDQEWEYPRLVNGTWGQFALHVEEELGKADSPNSAGLRLVRGDTGSSWEGWLMSALAEAARFRKAQRDIVSVRTLEAILGCDDPTLHRTIHETVLEVVELGDHAWNGSSEASKSLNLSIRRNRLALVERNIAAIRDAFWQGKSQESARRLAIVNTLGWARTCRVGLPEHVAAGFTCLADLGAGECFPILQQGDVYSVVVPEVPGFGNRMLEARSGPVVSDVHPTAAKCPLELEAMRPLLTLGDRQVAGCGGWESPDCGRWEIGPFAVVAHLSPLITDEGTKLGLSIEGTPPTEPYELRWLFELPWSKAIWRGESGGGFVTPGPAELGGDSLLGIVGSIFSCGEGLSAADPDGRECIDFAFDQTGLCGLGGQSTCGAQGTYGERLDAEIVSLSVWSSLLTDGRLELYLLGNKQNYREALLDQGGARHWDVRCALRRRAGTFDDAGLYRFANGFSYPAEVIDPERLSDCRQWLTVQGGDGVIPLQASRDKGMTSIYFYSTLDEAALLSLSGCAVEGRSVKRADMLSRVIGTCSGGKVTIDPLAYLRVIVE